MARTSRSRSEKHLDALQRLRADLRLYAESCLTIRKKNHDFELLEFDVAQEILHEELEKQLAETGRVRAVVLKARQVGVSTYVAARFFHKIHLWRGVAAMIVADTLKRAGILWQIYDRFRSNLPVEIAPGKRSTQRETTLAFSHDSELSVRPSSDTEAGRAATLHLLHASELAHWGHGLRETWVSLMNAVPPDGGEVIVESTARGAGGLFHELWGQATEGKSGWIAVFLPWFIHEEYDSKPGSWDPELERVIRERPDDFERQAMAEGIPFLGRLHVLPMSRLVWRRLLIAEKLKTDPYDPAEDAVKTFQQEYPATAEEAFLISGACFFDESQLRLMARDPIVRDPVTRGRMVERPTPRGGKVVGVEPNARGSVRIYEPPHPQLHYVVGADTAEGKISGDERLGALETEDEELGGRDRSAAVVVRLPYVTVEKKEDGTTEKTVHLARVAAELHGQLVPEVFAGQLRLLGKYYACGSEGVREDRRSALIAVERSHSSGQTVLRLLREHYRYAPLFWQREQLNKRTRRVGRRVGWITDETTRMPMLDELAQWVREARLEVPSKDVVREMVTFLLQKNGRPSAEEGCHDDRVIALAIAIQMIREHFHPRQASDPIPEALWWEQSGETNASIL